MPIITIEVSIEGDLSSEESVKKLNLSSKIKDHTDILQSKEYTLIIGTRRKNYLQSLKVNCPRFHRGKDEGWLLILADIKQRELLALKRISGVNNVKRNYYLQFCAPSNLGKRLYIYF